MYPQKILRCLCKHEEAHYQKKQSLHLPVKEEDTYQTKDPGPTSFWSLQRACSNRSNPSSLLMDNGEKFSSIDWEFDELCFDLFVHDLDFDSLVYKYG